MASESSLICNLQECTLGQTGKCVLDHDPKNCQERIKSLNFEEPLLDNLLKDIPSPEINIHRFSPSYTLSVSQVQNLMEHRYCRIVGILGAPGSGKTACLVSLYLMLAHARLSGFDFRDSKTLMAFEEISRGARMWKQVDSAENLTAHTEILDERTAGFLHLKLNQIAHNRTFDLLLPDLPGEWSNSLIDFNKTERMAFLKSAECIWLMVNGQDVHKAVSRHTVLHRLTLIIQRLASYLGDYKPSLVLTHKDKFSLPTVLFSKVLECAAENNFDINIKEIASFSDDKITLPGSGIVELLNDLLDNHKSEIGSFWPSSGKSKLDRQIMNFGKTNI